MRSAAVQRDGVNYWDLDAPEACFPIRVESGGKEYEVYVALAQPYSSSDLIEAINAMRGGYRRNQATLENQPGDEKLLAKMADGLFIRMDGTTGDVPAQKRFLDSNWKLKVRMIREGLGGIGIQRTTEDASPSELLELALDTASDTVIPATQTLWSPDLKQKLQITMKHRLRVETESDWRAWSRTSSERFTRASQSWSEPINWWARMKLYDDMVQSVEGALTDAGPCVLETKTQWVSKIPAWHKFLVIAEAFDEARVKN